MTLPTIGSPEHATKDRWAAVGFGVGIHVARFAVIVGALAVAPLLGIGGWYAGLFANAVCAIFAAALVTYFRLWRRIGMGVLWRGRTAALLLLPLIAETLLWLVPGGLIELPPGFGLWGLTLLLVGFNEELVSRGVVLERMRRSFGRYGAVAITAALFGMQHLSAFATTTRDPFDVLTNVLVSACYGFALAAFQFRFRWIWPLILIHGFADFTTILSADGLPDVVVVLTCAGFIVYGVLVLRGVPSAETPAGTPGPASRGPLPHVGARYTAP